jgi:predicted AlkP superfamily phosphohydrolase/phosphomutase
VTRVLVFGLDGATWDLIRPWAEQGKLPTLQHLMCQGVWGLLESTVPPMTSPAWPSFATGSYPAKHSVFDFVSAHSGTFNIVNATGVKAQPLWDILSAQGQRVGVMNVPVTYPPHPVNGFMISGLLSPSAAQITYPDDLLERYERATPGYQVMPSIQYKPGNEGQFLHALESLVDIRALYASRLMRDHQVDFMMVHFLATDLAQHTLWRHMDPEHPQHVLGNPFQQAIQRIYQRVDRAMGKLLQQVDDDTTVIVLSDHGFGPLHGVVNLNILLWEQGLLTLKRAPWIRLRAALFRRGLTPKTVYNWLVRLNLQNVVARVSKSTRNAVYNKFLSFDDLDWSRTIAYSLGHMGQIYINVEGRNRNGIVARGAAYEEAIERVIAALDTLTLPNGRPMVDRVVRASDLPGGAYADEGPDLHVVLDGYRYISCPLFATDGSVLSKQIRGDSGSHRLHGVFVAAGPHIRTGEYVQHARIVDLAPTILYLMGCPVPDKMDGCVLTEALRPAFVGQHAPPSQTAGGYTLPEAESLSAREEAEVKLRLKGLGYLD